MGGETVGSIKVVATIDTKNYDSGKKHIERGNEDLEKGAGKTARGFSAAWAGAIGGLVATVAQRGFDMISNSIEGAVKRVDTLNNSTRTFENMGIATADSKKAMDALQKSIKGLPTPLDGAVRGMTALTATYGNIDRGQKVFSALNNAILGFGGSASMVDNAITQLSQLPMDGPLDAQTWNSLRNSGITPVLVAMAKDSGMSVSQMKEAFGSGELSVQDFTDRLIKLNEEGGGGLKSLETIAKDSTSGIGTGFANMQTSIVRGMGELVEAIGSENISNALSEIGSAFETTLGFIADSLQVLLKGEFESGMFGGWLEEDSAYVDVLFDVRDAFIALPGAIDATATSMQRFGNFIRDNIAVLISFGVAIAALAAPFIAASVSATIFNAQLGFMIARARLASVLKVITGSVKAFNAALLANPIGLIIAAIALLVGALILLWNNNEAFRNSIIGAWNAIKSAWSGAVDFFSGIINSIVMFFQALPGKISSFFGQVWEAVKNTFNAFVDFVRNNWFLILLTVITGGLFLIVAAFIRNWDSIKSFTLGLIKGVISFFSELPGKIGAFAVAAWNALVAAWNGAVAWFGSLISGVFSWFARLPGMVLSYAQWSWNNLVSVWNGIGSFFSGVINSIVDWFRKLPDRIREQAESAKNSITSIDWAGIGMDIIRGIGDGIASMGGWLADKAKAAVGDAKDQLKSFLKIQSPSRVMRDEIGKMMGMGIAVGITSSASSAVSAAQNTASAIMGAFRTSASQYSSRYGLNAATGSLVDGEYATGKSIVNQSTGLPEIGGSSTEYNISNITISSEVDGERWLRRLTNNQEIVSAGLVPNHSWGSAQ